MDTPNSGKDGEDTTENEYKDTDRTGRKAVETRILPAFAGIAGIDREAPFVTPAADGQEVGNRKKAERSEIIDKLKAVLTTTTRIIFNLKRILLAFAGIGGTDREALEMPADEEEEEGKNEEEEGKNAKRRDKIDKETAFQTTLRIIFNSKGFKRGLCQLIQQMVTVCVNVLLDRQGRTFC